MQKLGIKDIETVELAVKKAGTHGFSNFVCSQLDVCKKWHTFDTKMRELLDLGSDATSRLQGDSTGMILEHCWKALQAFQKSMQQAQEAEAALRSLVDEHDNKSTPAMLLLHSLIEHFRGLTFAAVDDCVKLRATQHITGVEFGSRGIP